MTGRLTYEELAELAWELGYDPTSDAPAAWQAGYDAAIRTSGLRETLEEIRRHMPYPRDWPGLKLSSMAWSMPPSTEKELRRLVGDPTKPSPLLAAAEAKARAAGLEEPA